MSQFCRYLIAVLLVLIHLIFMVPQESLAEPSPPEDTVSAESLNPLAGAAYAAGSYILGPGDQIQVLNPAEGFSNGTPLTMSTTVSPDGTISVYPVGVLFASGKTLGALEKEINQKAATLLKSPQITISLQQSRPATIYVLGYVANPGRYQNGYNLASQTCTAPISKPEPGTSTSGGGSPSLSGSVSMSQSLPPDVLTVLTAIQLSGGVRESADIRHISVKNRNSSVAREVDLWRLIVEGVDKQDILLQDGDVVFVPKGGEAFNGDLLGSASDNGRPVRIIGDIKMPGVYILGPTDDLLSIIARAGGFNHTAQMRFVILSRMNRDGKIETHRVSIPRSVKNGNYIGRVPILPGDLVQVKTSYVKRAGPRVAITLGTLTSAFIILYLSRIIVDQSNPSSP